MQEKKQKKQKTSVHSNVSQGHDVLRAAITGGSLPNEQMHKAVDFSPAAVRQHMVPWVRWDMLSIWSPNLAPYHPIKPHLYLS